MENNSKKIVKNISWSFAEKLLTDGISMFITIILARLLYPEDYGLVALVQVFINISSIFVSTGLGTALIQNKNADDEQTSTIFYTNLIIGVILYAILFIGAPALAKYRGNIELVHIIRVLSLKIPITSVYNIQHAYIKKRGEFKKFFFSSLLGTIMSGVVGITMAFMGFGAWALVCSVLVDNIMDSIILFMTTKWLPKPCLKIKKSKKMLRFGIQVLISEFIVRFYAQMRSLIIGIKYSSSDLAFSTKGQKFPQSIIDVFDATLIRVMLPTLSEIQDDRRMMKSVTSISTQLYMFLIAPMMVGLIAVADKFVVVLLTEKWILCTPFLQIYCLNYLVTSLTKTDKSVIEACGEGEFLIKQRIIETVVSLSLILIAIFYFDSAIYIIIGMVISNAINSSITIYKTNRLIDYGFISHARDLFGVVVSTLVMYVVVSASGLLLLNMPLVIQLIIQILIGCIVYLSTALLIKSKPMMYSIDFFKNKRK